MVIEEIIIDLMDSYLTTNNTTYKKTTTNRIASTRKPQNSHKTHDKAL